MSPEDVVLWEQRDLNVPVRGVLSPTACTLLDSATLGDLTLASYRTDTGLERLAIYRDDGTHVATVLISDG